MNSNDKQIAFDAFMSTFRSFTPGKRELFFAGWEARAAIHLDASGGQCEPHQYTPHVLPGAPRDRCHECGLCPEHPMHAHQSTGDT